jgi:N-acetylneuraminic acid mutarotase
MLIKYYQGNHAHIYFINYRKVFFAFTKERMELFPIYEENTKISENLWYSISGIGESPFMRVGHTIVHVRDQDDKLDKGKFYIIGGANPSESFNDVYCFDFAKLNWDKLGDLEHFKTGRYEHSCFYDNHEKNIFVFGGSSELGILNDMLKFGLERKICENLIAKNNPPSARTIHSGVVYKNQLIIFGGGAESKKPVSDENVNIFDPLANKWISLNINKNNKRPNNRQGHLMINHNDELIYLHGGMDEHRLYDDLWTLDLKLMEWKDQNQEVNLPCARAAHGGISVNNFLYVFGGINSNNMALDDLWRYDIGN